MKKTKTICLTILFVNFLFTITYSQITYNSTDFASVNDSFIVSKANSVQLFAYDFQQTGANHIWDYDTLSANTQKYQKYIDPDNSEYKINWITNCVSGGGGVVWCNNSWNDTTNLCLISEDTLVIGPISLSNIAELYKKNSQVLEKSIKGMTVGFGQLPVKMVANYTNADTIFNFPIQYLNADSASSAYNADFNSVGIDIIIKKNQKRVNYVEGWGSLTTPYGTYSSVLKMKTLIYHNDSTFFGGNPAPPNQTVDVIYQWFNSAFGIPVLTVEGKIVGSTETYSKASYIDSVRCLQPNSFFAYTPLIPYLDGSSNADVTFTNMSNNSDIYNWDFDDGNTSVQTNPTNTFTSAGTYLVQLIATNTVCSPFEHDTLIIPIIVKDSNAVAANFYYTPISPCNGDTVFFTNTSLNATQYNWDFGDGSSSTLFNPYNIYNTSGIFNVELIASDGITNDTTIKVITINTEIIDAGNDTTIILGNTAYLQVTGGAGVFTWQSDPTLSCIICSNPIATPTITTTYYVSKTNSCGIGTDSVTVYVNPVSIENINNNNIKIFPNPTTGIITIEGENIESVIVTDVTGQLIKRINQKKQKIIIDLSGQSKGLYFVQVKTDKGTKIEKIIIE